MDNRGDKRHMLRTNRRVISRDIKRRTYIALAVFLCFIFVLLKVVSRESHVTDTAKASSFRDANLTNTQTHALERNALERNALKLRLRELKMHNALRFVKAEHNAQVPSTSGHSSEKIEPESSSQTQLLEQKISQWEANFLNPH